MTDCAGAAGVFALNTRISEIRRLESKILAFKLKSYTREIRIMTFLQVKMVQV